MGGSLLQSNASGEGEAPAEPSKTVLREFRPPDSCLTLDDGSAAA